MPLNMRRMLNETNIADRVHETGFHSGPQAREDSLQVRLATSAKDIDAAQALRYRVFFEEMNGRPSIAAKWRQRDFDAHDAVADHLLVIDPRRGSGEASVVGTYRLLRGRAARSLAYLPPPGFCTAAEFDIEPLLQCPGEILELGRACVDPAYRSRKTIDRLWQGIAAYIHAYNVNLMFGTVSFQGTDPNELLNELALLHHKYLAPIHLRPRAVTERFVAMNRIPAVAVDERKAWKSLPPLMKGYIRLGGVFGEGAVVDHEFGTTDACVVVPVNRVSDRYQRRYQGDRDATRIIAANSLPE